MVQNKFLFVGCGVPFTAALLIMILSPLGRAEAGPHVGTASASIMTVESPFYGIEAGDWVQVVAGFLGVGSAIMGTLYLILIIWGLSVEHKMGKAVGREDRAWIADVVTTLAKQTAAIVEGLLPYDPTNYEHYTKSVAMQRALRLSLDKYQTMRRKYRVEHLALWRALEVLDRTVSEHAPVLEKELRILTADGHHTQLFSTNRVNVMVAASPISEAAQAAALQV